MMESPVVCHAVAGTHGQALGMAAKYQASFKV
jgi:hypothetical protein